MLRAGELVSGALEMSISVFAELVCHLWSGVAVCIIIKKEFVLLEST